MGKWILAALVLAPTLASGASHRERSHGETMVIVEGDSVTGRNITINGDTDGPWERLQRREKGPFIYFEREGQAYVIRDPALLKEAHTLFEPQRKLGDQQGALGQKQGELGEQQGALGAKQAELGERMAARAGRGDSRDDLRDLQSQQRELGEQQRRLGEKQRELGEEQRRLGEQQRELGEKAERAFSALVDRALASGKAERVSEAQK